MELRKIKINNNEYTFVNEYYETSNSWGHRTTLFKNDYEISDYKIRYLNRTWEAYTYQSVMRSCVNDIIDNKLKSYINSYKYNNNITRFKSGQKDKITQEFYEQEEIKELQQVYEALRDRVSA